MTITNGGRRAADVAIGLRFRGPIEALTADERRFLFERTTSSDDVVRARTAEIIVRVRREGDAEQPRPTRGRGCSRRGGGGASPGRVFFSEEMEPLRARVPPPPLPPNHVSEVTRV